MVISARFSETSGQSPSAGVLCQPGAVSGVICRGEATVIVPEGQFVFANLRFSTLGGGYGMIFSLDGQATNSTSKDWLDAHFILKIYDDTSNPILNSRNRGSDFPFAFENWKRGEEEELKLARLPALWTVEESTWGEGPSRYEIAFAGGHYPALYRISMVKPTTSDITSFQDSFISVVFAISKKQIDFALQNRTPEPIKIDWNQVSYVDVTGKSHRVVHEGVRLIDKDRPQAPTIVPPTARVEDIILPSDYAQWTGSDWEVRPLLPEGPLAKTYEGQSFSIFMILEVNGRAKNYLFTFKIRNVQT
jgi:hypothetical protein